MKKLILTTVTLGLIHSNIAQAQDNRKCLQPGQAEALITYVLPKAIEAAQSKCSSVLPAESSLMESDSDRLSEYQTASDAAWPKAKEAVSAISGDKLPADIDDALLKPLTDSIFTGMISDEIKPKDCPTIDKIYSDLAPLPSSNIASLTVTIIQAATKDDENSSLPICKAPV